MKMPAHQQAEAAGRPVHWPSLPQALAQQVGTWTTHRGEPLVRDGYGFNLGLHVGDDAPVVQGRRAALQTLLGVRPVWMRQVHGIDCANAASIPYTLGDVIEADACVSRVPLKAPVVMTADCLPVLMVTEAGDAVAAVHCGWRGLLKGVLEEAVRGLTHPGHPRSDRLLYAWLGPAIGPQSFQVGAEVREAYLRKNAVFEDCFHPDSTGAYRADLYGLAQHTLKRICGSAVCIDSEAIDTLTNPQFNSFRRSPVSGRQASLIWLRA